MESTPIFNLLNFNTIDKYEIEKRLADKADKWQFHNLETENHNLRSKVDDLQGNIVSLKSEIEGLKQSVRVLIEVLIENGVYIDETTVTRLENLKQYV